MKTRAAVLLSIWFAIVAALAAYGVFAGPRPPTLQVLVAAEVLVLVLFYVSSRPFGEFARSISLSRLTVFHLWRVLPGAGFLLLYHRGLMPRDFAVPAGVGDMAVALLAPAFAILATRSSSSSTKAVLAFHILGLLDLVMVVGNAARISLADPASMRILAEAPRVIVPIFFVPLTIFLHIVSIDLCRRAITSKAKTASSHQ
jgi:hypothetical protein